jgi:hypothetical protein
VKDRKSLKSHVRLPGHGKCFPQSASLKSHFPNLKITTRVSVKTEIVGEEKKLK